MSVGNPNANPRFLKSHAVIEQKGPFRDAEGNLGLRVSGWVACETCGQPVVSRTELAALAGVSPAAASKFLNREPGLRPDVAAKIRASVKAVR